ncbi:CALMODULIN-BINDING TRANSCRIPTION ACTIVATOR CAMTA [Salix purpurea]|uniref:CALMODULIN-BINDING TRANSCRIPTION ACTIVATOR CAMTA n=1 Tax=Salix purpurea TaxID=77065 RepID=A0A9Q0ZNA0_SALPP|nr:CALMODULIN-BINDING TRANSCRIPTION ACTIVATOR CAMTA [Salix purpurea]
MADTKHYPLGNQLDIQQILVEAQHRWLRPAEICEILSNYQKFSIAPEPAHMPPSGSLFLFDRKVLRYFRKDGHNWRKKKDGKTVKEAHERLKSGSIDVLHCYYAHGEDNENFQRRSYWLLEEKLSHIVLVHYREVKQGTRTNFNRIKEYEEHIPFSQEIEDTIPSSEMDTSVSSGFRPNGYQVPTRTTDTTSMNSAQASEYEDAESVYNNQASSRFHSFLEVQKPAMERIDTGSYVPYDHMTFSSDYQGKSPVVPGMDLISLAQVDKTKDTFGTESACQPQKVNDLPSWEDVFENCVRGIESVPFQTFLSQVDTVGIIPKQEDEILEKLLTNSSDKREDIGSHILDQEAWQSMEDASSHPSKRSMDQKLLLDSGYDLTARFPDQQLDSGDLISTLEPFYHDSNLHIQNDIQIQPADVDHVMTLEGKSMYSSSVKHHILDGSRTEGLKKLDSFTRWMSKELGDVEPQVQSSYGAYLITTEGENGVDDSSNPSQGHLETYLPSSSPSQDQLFSIIDFSPNWAYAGTEIKVLIMGRFLKGREAAEKCKWSIMFGEAEVPAEVIADGVLRCNTPSHKAGRVPFYVTCSNTIACSEVCEFEYRLSHTQDITYNYSDSVTEDLNMRFGKLLSLSSVSPSKYDSSTVDEIMSSKINSLLNEDNETWDQMLELTSEEGFSSEKVKELLVQKLLKEQLHVWLLQKATEGGKGPGVLDEGGQGVLHFAAALGYDWALEPTIVAGVSVNFRDVNGWTALHWAASYGRERTVAFLINLGAAPGALTDPTPKYPTSRTPADLASANGHKGISGFLAESALSAHLSSLNLEKQAGEAAESSGTKVLQALPGCNKTSVNDADLPSGQSLKDSLAAVCNATQAAARIHQVFRVQSFQKKQLKEYGDDKSGMSHERALSLIAVKSQKAGQCDEPVHAAIRIQNKFRGWKGRKEFLIIRQRIVKIQAHVRGHQVRKNYRKIIWSVGLLDKIILRWRRKRSGLRGFKSEALTDGSSMQIVPSKDDDDDFLKEGRRQTEERSQIALARVKSMHQHPEAREQYRRLRNVVAEIQEAKAVCDWANNPEVMAEFGDLVDLGTLMDGDSFMPTNS